MSRFRNITAIFTVLLTVSACEVDFDLKGLDGDPIFVLDGNMKIEPDVPDNGHLVMFLYAVPSTAGDRVFSEEARCTLKVYRNGEHIDTKDYITIEPFFGLIADIYPDVNPGDEITLTAESEGFPTVSVTTMIPQTPPAVQVSCTRTGNNIGVRFSLEDDAGSSDAYAFSFETITSESKPGPGDYGATVEIPYLDPETSSLLGLGPFDVIWEDGIKFYGIFDDDFNGGKKEMEVNFSGDSFQGQGTSYLRIEVIRLSPERLRYQIACQDKGSDILGFIGLAPVTFAYTNVKGGSGCFSGQNISYTDWIAIPEAE